jgi:hypothetical protein
MAMDVDSDDNVIEMKPSVVSQLLEDDDGAELTPALREFMAKSDARPVRDAKPPAAEQAGEPEAAAVVSPEELAPLPTAGNPYKAHARIANRPLATIFFLPEGQLPDGFSYDSLERVRMVEPHRPGGSPDLLLRFNGSVVSEVRIEGRDLLALCDYIGRHLIHWVRQHPGGRERGDGSAPFIRRITISVIEE